MAGNSVYKVTFHLDNSAGRMCAGPYTTNVGISGGSRGDGHTVTLAASLIAAITSNLLAILQAQGFSGVGVPGGTVAIDTYSHASTPDCWI